MTTLKATEKLKKNTKPVSRKFLRIAVYFKNEEERDLVFRAASANKISASLWLRLLAINEADQILSK